MTREMERPPHADAGRHGPTTSPLAIYLNDHLLGATSGAELARRVATQHARTPAGQTLIRLADEIAEDRLALLQVMSDLDVPARRYKIYAGWLLEKAGRAKSNGFLIRRAPLSSLLELETLRMGVEGKLLMWNSLSMLTGPQATRLDVGLLAELSDRARNQRADLEALRLPAATAILALP